MLPGEGASQSYPAPIGDTGRLLVNAAGIEDKYKYYLLPITTQFLHGPIPIHGAFQTCCGHRSALFWLLPGGLYRAVAESYDVCGTAETPSAFGRRGWGSDTV
jgi:hypothetical protein